MSEPVTHISPLALCVLELLDERPMHPYELAVTMRARHHDEFIRLNFGSLYHAVDSLERNGWVVSVERQKEGRRPERTIYQLTKSGREQLIRVISEIIAEPRREYPHFSAGLMFMHHLDASEAVGHLRRRAEALSAVSDKLRRILAELRADGLTRLSIIELEHKIAILDAERIWVRTIEQEITEGRLEWAVGRDSGHERLRSRHV